MVFYEVECKGTNIGGAVIRTSDAQARCLASFKKLYWFRPRVQEGLTSIKAGPSIIYGNNVFIGVALRRGAR
jgi:hypothetical protein